MSIFQFFIVQGVSIAETSISNDFQYNADQSNEKIMEDSKKNEINTDEKTNSDLIESTNNKDKINSESIELESVKKRVADKIGIMSFDDILEDFGGRRVHVNAFKDSGMHVQVSENNVDLDKYQLDETFNEVKEKRVEFVEEIISNFSDYNNLSPEELENKLFETLNSLLMVRIYIERWYGIEINGSKLSDELYFNEKTADNVFEIAKKFNAKPEIMESNITGQTYRIELAKYFNYNTVKDVVESFIFEKAKTTDYDDWFKSYFGGIVIELKSSFKQLEVTTWEKICNNLSDELSSNHLLPILSMKNPENMIIANVQGLIIYTTKHNFENYEKKVLEALENFDYYLETLIKTQSSEIERNRIINELRTIPVFDSELDDDMQFDYFNEKNSLSNGFYKTIHHLGPIKYQAWVANAYADKKSINFVSGLLDSNWGGTLAHEYFHNVGALVMNSNLSSNWGYRNYNHVEVIPARIDYTWSYDDGIIFSIYEKDAYVMEGLSHSGGRFQESRDIQEFYKGVMGLIYGLDVVVADVILSLPIEEQVGYIRKWNKSNNSITTLNKDELLDLNLLTIRDLVDSDIGIFDKSISDGPTPNNYGLGSSYYSKDSHYFIPEDGVYDSQVSEFPYMVQMVDELFSLQNYSGWDAVNLFFANGTGASTNLDALRLVMNDPTFTFKDFRKMQLNTYGNKIKANGLTEDSYKEVFEKIKNNLENIRAVKEDYYLKYNRLTSEFRTSLFAEENRPIIDAPQIKKLTTFSTEVTILNPKLEDDLTYELIVLVNNSEAKKVFIKSEEKVTIEMSFNKGDKVTAYIIGTNEAGDRYTGEEAEIVVQSIESIDELIIPPLDPNLPEIQSPRPENLNMGEGLAIVYVSDLIFPKIINKKNSQSVSVLPDNTTSESDNMVAIANYKNGGKMKRQWTLQVSQNKMFENGSTLVFSPIVAEQYRMEYGITIPNQEIYINTKSSVVALSDGSGDEGIVPIGIGNISLEVPGNTGIGVSNSTIKWELVSEPEI